MKKFLLVVLLVLVFLPLGCNLLLPECDEQLTEIRHQWTNLKDGARLAAAGFNLTISYFLPLQNSRSISF